MPHDGCTGDADRSSQSNILSEWRNAMPHHMRASFASDVIVQKRRRRIEEEEEEADIRTRKLFRPCLRKLSRSPPSHIST
jgi:hypothetical protein